MDKRHFGLGGAILGIALAIYLTLLWQPERQVRLHQLHFLQAVEKRDWPRVLPFIADNYSDRWEHDKNLLVADGRQFLQHFLILSIQSEELGMRCENNTGLIEARLRLEGNGSPIAHMIMQRTKEFTDPFEFEWQKQNWKPWTWKLTRINHAALEIPVMSDM